MGRGKIFINWAEFKSGINQIQEHIYLTTLRSTDTQFKFFTSGGNF